MSQCPMFLYRSDWKHTKYHKELTPAQLHAGRMANLRGIVNLSQTLNVVFLVMHGSLLGWTFNEQLLPWDEDVDVSYLYRDDRKLRNAIADDRRFVGPSTYVYALPVPRNHIEFRVVHASTGVYTDITSLRLTSERSVLRANTISRPRKGRPPLYAMKSSFHNLWGGHLYRPDDIDPPTPCRVHGLPLHCPNRPHHVLAQEYRHYRSHNYKRWRFDNRSMCWIAK